MFSLPAISRKDWLISTLWIKIAPIFSCQLCLFLGKSQMGFPLLFTQQKYFSFTWKPSIFFKSCISTPSCSKLQYFSAEVSWQSSKLNYSVCTLPSQLIFKHNNVQNRQSSASWFVFEAHSFQPLVLPVFHFVKKLNDFFDWMTRWSYD